MEKKFLTLERARKLEETVGLLTHYKPVDGEIHFIGLSLEEVDEKHTQLFRRLGELHLEQEKIMKELMG